MCLNHGGVVLAGSVATVCVGAVPVAAVGAAVSAGVGSLVGEVVPGPSIGSLSAGVLDSSSVVKSSSLSVPSLDASISSCSLLMNSSSSAKFSKSVFNLITATSKSAGASLRVLQLQK